MQFFKVKNWDEIQHYRDRTPPWIKLYNHLLDDYEFACLQDASKLHLILIWLLASRNSNRLPFNAKWIKQRIGVDSDVDLSALLQSGFIELEPSNDGVSQLVEQDASKTLARCNQSADTEERESRGERERRESKAEESKSLQASHVDDVKTVFDFWHSTMKKTEKTKLTDGRRRVIKSRLKNFTVGDIQQAVVGCTKSSHHMGANPQSNPEGRRYDDLTLICRNDENVERFMNYAVQVSIPDAKQQEVDDWINGDQATQQAHDGEVFDNGQY